MSSASSRAGRRSGSRSWRSSAPASCAGSWRPRSAWSGRSAWTSVLTAAWTSTSDLQLDAAAEVAPAFETVADPGLACVLGLRLAAGELERALAVDPPLLAEPFELPVETGDLSLTFVDQVAESAAVACAAEDAHVLERASGVVQRTRCAQALLLERAVPLAQPAVVGRKRATVEHGRRASNHIEGERLGGRAAEGLREPV